MTLTSLTPHGSDLQARSPQPNDNDSSASKLKFGILDPGLISAGKTAAQTIDETLKSASLADSLGYSRYWLTEHHQSAFAWACPEILLTSLTQHTKQIRLGTAGILLYYYSPLKIAEIFRLLAVLYPQRIDLGIARGYLAEDSAAVRALYGDVQPAQELRKDIYAQKVESLITYLSNNFPLKHRYIKTISHLPQMWLLGTGRSNMNLAAAKGKAFSYSLCHGASRCNPDILAEYRHNFQSSRMLSNPKCNVAVAVICAETEAKAKQQKLVFDQESRGTARVNVVGTLEQCKEQLLKIQHQYKVNEIILLSASKTFEHRQLFYQMLAESFDLSTLES